MGRVYSLAAWQTARRLALSREPLCRACKARGILTPGHHVDHIIPISQGGAWFDADNLAVYCAPCHSAKTIGDKGGVARMGAGVDGTPIDPNHHWNR